MLALLPISLLSVTHSSLSFFFSSSPLSSLARKETDRLKRERASATTERTRERRARPRQDDDFERFEGGQGGARRGPRLAGRLRRCQARLLESTQGGLRVKEDGASHEKGGARGGEGVSEEKARSGDAGVRSGFNRQARVQPDERGAEGRPRSRLRQDDRIGPRCEERRSRFEEAKN